LRKRRNVGNEADEAMLWTRWKMKGMERKERKMNGNNVLKARNRQ